ncbi:MAG: hypothetical protein ACREQ7_13030 [Candidatus Binatia bacterium]
MKNKRAERTESNRMEFGKYVNILVILNAMVRRFRETLVLIREEQARTNAYGTAAGGQVDDSGFKRTL